MRHYKSFDQHLDETLKDPKEAALYVEAAAEYNDPEFLLLALSQVARAHGLTKISKHADISRMGLYKIFSKSGNPELRTFLKILDAAGLEISFKPKKLAA